MNAAMTHEEKAYQEMHEELFAKYPGQHVAIYQGKLVDYDKDGAYCMNESARNIQENLYSLHLSVQRWKKHTGYCHSA